MSESRHILGERLDARLRLFAARSRNAHEAVYRVQQMTSLMPSFAADLVQLQGPEGVEHARRTWIAIGELLSVITRLPFSTETVVTLGFPQVLDIGGIEDAGQHRKVGPNVPQESAAAGEETLDLRNAYEGLALRILISDLGDCPTHFPLWEGRPLFLHEQKALMQHLAHMATAEISLARDHEDSLNGVIDLRDSRREVEAVAFEFPELTPEDLS